MLLGQHEREVERERELEREREREREGGEKELERERERETGSKEGGWSSSLRGTYDQAESGSGSGQVSIASLRLVIFLTAFQSRIVRTDVSSFPTQSLAHPSVTQITCHILRFQLEENDSK